MKVTAVHNAKLVAALNTQSNRNTKESTMSNPTAAKTTATKKTTMKTTAADKKLAAVAKKINAAPKAEAKKPAAKKVRKARAGAFDVTAKIEVLAAECPKRDGSAAAKRWAACKPGRTVAEAIEKGATMGSIRWNVEHGHLALSK